MISPDYLEKIMRATEDIVGVVNERLIDKIVKRIIETFENGTGDLFIPATRADLKLLLRGNMLYNELQEEIEKRLSDIQGAVREAFYQSADEIELQNLEVARMITELKGLNVLIPEPEKIGLPKTAKDLNMTEIEIRKLEMAYRRTRGSIINMTQTAARFGSETYVEACDIAYAKAQRGVSIQEAVIDAIKDVSKEGIKCVEYDTGRVDKIEVAIARAVRTGVNQANSEIVMTRCAEMGVKYVYVSEHMGARVTKFNDYTNHSWWQGQVYSVDWSKNDTMKELYEGANIEEKGFEWLNEMREEMQKLPQPEYPDLVEHTGYGRMLGLCGINCRHNITPFYPGINIDRGQQIDRQENEDFYKLTQKQRAMERSIRDTKRELFGISHAGRTDEEFKAEKKKLKDKLYKQSDAYMDFCKKNKLKPRNMSLQIGRTK